MSLRLSTRDVSTLLSNMGMERAESDPVVAELLARNGNDYISFESFALGVMKNLYKRVVELEAEKECQSTLS